MAGVAEGGKRLPKAGQSTAAQGKHQLSAFLSHQNSQSSPLVSVRNRKLARGRPSTFDPTPTIGIRSVDACQPRSQPPPPASSTRGQPFRTVAFNDRLAKPIDSDRQTATIGAASERREGLPRLAVRPAGCLASCDTARPLARLRSCQRSHMFSPRQISCLRESARGSYLERLVGEALLGGVLAKRAKGPDRAPSSRQVERPARPTKRATVVWRAPLAADASGLNEAVPSRHQPAK